MTQASHATGQKGELIAQSLYRRQGFEIKALNWRVGRVGEIDLIAFHPQSQVLAFIEVKTRKNQNYGHPLEAIGPTKQAQLARLAEAYLSEYPPGPKVQVRFDVVGIYYPGQGRPAEVSHLENAF